MASENIQMSLMIDQSLQASKSADGTAIWNPGKPMWGSLELSSQNEINILDVSIYFEGISRNWISEMSDVDFTIITKKTESKFLSQTQTIVLEDVLKTHESVDHPFNYEIPFYFNIPKAIPRLNSDRPEHCLQLPPSLELGEVFVDVDTRKKFAQPSISYKLRALVTLGGNGDNKPIETMLPVIIAPYTEEFPPTSTNDFLAEFKEHILRTLRRQLMPGSLGEMSVSTSEPSDLRFEGGATEASTFLSVNFEVEPKSFDQLHHSLQGFSLKIVSLLRVKTFYSLQAFPKLPSQSLLSYHGTMRLRDEMIKLKPRTFKDISWKYVYELNGKMKAQTEPQSLTSAPKGKWTATLDIPIYAPHRFLPTFCTSVVAQLYSIIIRIKVGGVRVEDFDLEVPVQVIQRFPMRKTPRYEEEGEFEVFRRVSDSDASWFSEESLIYFLMSREGGLARLANCS